MKTIKVNSTLILEERESFLHYDPIEKQWTMDAMTPKIFRKALKQGWTPLVQYVYEDGTVCGMVLTAPERCVTIRSTTKKQMSEKQLGNLFQDNDDE